MEKRTIVRLSISAVIAVAAVIFACGIGRGGRVEYQLPGPYAAESTNDFSTVKVEMTVQDGAIADCAITSSGDSDLLNEETRSAWAQSIVEAQSYETDAISSSTLTYSAASVKEAARDIFTQAGLPLPEPAATPEPTPEPEAPREAAALTDGTYQVQKTTDFSTIDLSLTVEGGAVTDASVASEGANDLLTDEMRAAWADQIVAGGTVDAVSGVTVSSDAVKAGFEELLAQAAGGGETDDEKLAALEAALAEAQARAAEAEARAAEAETRMSEAEARAAEAESLASEAEAKAAELEAAAAAPVDDLPADLSAYTRPRPLAGEAAGDADLSAYTRPRPLAGETAGEGTSDADLSAYTRPRPVAGETAGEGAGDADLSAYTRPRPVAGETASEGAADADLSAYTRPRPVAGETASEGAADADLSAYTRPRPVSEADSANQAAALTEEARLAAILPHIVTTMGDNSANSYVTDYLEQDPYLTNIYEGYGFAVDYGSARGHTYTLEDVAKTQRPHPKANCITCKTPDLHKMIAEQGVSVYAMPFDEVYPLMNQSISCYTCHGDDLGNGGQLAVTHQYVNEALGENASAIAPATLSCGQCHIEYYFTPADSETMMPYHSIQEMTPEAILAYYDALDFADWTQASTGTPMLKAQHPELETYLQGKHAAFLTCADCHMPAETTGDGLAYRSHTLVSPLENAALLASCAQCHGDTDMTAFVRGIQQTVTERERTVGNALSDMKDALAEAVASGAWREEDLDAVRKLHREAQWFFDYCYVENSEGAHNSELSLHCLDTAQEKIDRAVALMDAHAAT